jgi:hypothetical protein
LIERAKKPAIGTTKAKTATINILPSFQEQ